MVTAQFLGKIDHNSLLVQDDYIFVKVNNATFNEIKMGGFSHIDTGFLLLFRDFFIE